MSSPSAATSGIASPGGELGSAKARDSHSAGGCIGAEGGDAGGLAGCDATPSARGAGRPSSVCRDRAAEATDVSGAALETGAEDAALCRSAGVAGWVAAAGTSALGGGTFAVGGVERSGGPVRAGRLLRSVADAATAFGSATASVNPDVRGKAPDSGRARGSGPVATSALRSVGCWTSSPPGMNRTSIRSPDCATGRPSGREPAAAAMADGASVLVVSGVLAVSDALALAGSGASNRDIAASDWVADPMLPTPASIASPRMTGRTGFAVFGRLASGDAGIGPMTGAEGAAVLAVAGCGSGAADAALSVRGKDRSAERAASLAISSGIADPSGAARNGVAARPTSGVWVFAGYDGGDTDIFGISISPSAALSFT